MKVLALIAAVCFVGVLCDLSEEKKAELRGFRTECIKETSVEEAMINKALEGEWAEDNKLQCYFACMMKKIRAMNEDGTLNEEKIRKRIRNDLSEDKIDGIMTKCKDKKGANACETAMELMKCYVAEKAFVLIITEKNK